MAINLVDYDVLAEGEKVYSDNARELDGILKNLNAMNGRLSDGWQNETARAFVDRFENDYAKKIDTIIKDLISISEYIKKYSVNRQDEDTQGASSISG